MQFKILFILYSVLHYFTFTNIIHMLIYNQDLIKSIGCQGIIVFYIFDSSLQSNLVLI